VVVVVRTLAAATRFIEGVSSALERLGVTHIRRSLMGKLKFDGERLKDGSKTIANPRDDRLRKGTGTSVLCNIRGDTVREGTGTEVIFDMRGDDLRLGTSTSRIGTMKDVDGAIEGPGGITKAALWFWFVR
jgi:hypothetical protein